MRWGGGGRRTPRNLGQASEFATRCSLSCQGCGGGRHRPRRRRRPCCLQRRPRWVMGQAPSARPTPHRPRAVVVGGAGICPGTCAPPHCLVEGRPHLGPAPTFYLARLSGSRASSVVGSSVGPGPRRRSHRRFPPQGVPRRPRASPWWLGAQHFCRSSSQLRAGSPSRCFGQRRCSPHRSGGVGRPRAGPPLLYAAWPPRWWPSPCSAPRPSLPPPVGAEGLAVDAEGLARATEGLGRGATRARHPPPRPCPPLPRALRGEVAPGAGSAAPSASPRTPPPPQPSLAWCTRSKAREGGSPPRPPSTTVAETRQTCRRSLCTSRTPPPRHARPGGCTGRAPQLAPQRPRPGRAAGAFGSLLVPSSRAHVLGHDVLAEQAWPQPCSSSSIYAPHSCCGPRWTATRLFGASFSLPST